MIGSLGKRFGDFGLKISYGNEEEEGSAEPCNSRFSDGFRRPPTARRKPSEIGRRKPSLDAVGIIAFSSSIKTR